MAERCGAEREKLVGILTEMSAQMNYIEYLVTGIGINANLREFPEELEDKATSLQKRSGIKSTVLH